MVHPRIRRWGVLACGVVAFVSLGTGQTAAQGDAERLRAEIREKQDRLRLLQGQLGPIAGQADDMRRNGLVAVETARGTVLMTREALTRSLRQSVIVRAVSAWQMSGDYGQLRRLADENWIMGQTSEAAREVTAASESYLQGLMHSQAQIEAEMAVLRGQLDYLEEQLRRQTGSGGRSLPPGSSGTPGVMGQWAPASRRVCPSPLFGKLLWSASGARCVGDEDTLFPGWRFGENTPLVCAHCTPNCSFAEEPDGRLICVVTGVAGAPPGPSATGRPPAPRTPPGAPSPTGRPEDLSARKKALGQELERIRLAGRWSADHHYQVGVWLGNANTAAQLDAVETLMYDYAACYERSNTERDKILEAARAGRYRTPGERIGALDAVGRAFNACLDTARAKRNAAIGR